MNWKAIITTLAITVPVLAACASLEPGKVAKDVSVKATESNPTGQIDQLVVWKTTTGYVLTGRLTQFGSDGVRRGHIHVGPSNTSSGNAPKWETFASAGDLTKRGGPYVSQFQLDLGSLAPSERKLEVTYHGGVHS